MVRNCQKHPDRAADLDCSRCGAPLCAACIHRAGFQELCATCHGLYRRRRGLTFAAGTLVALGALA